MSLKSYRDLEIWQVAMDLVVMSYEFSRKLPESERYGLISQLQRSAVSVPANIAEGYARSHRGDYLRHLSIARDSLAELETHVTLAVRLEYAPRKDALALWDMAQRVGKMANRLIASHPSN